jgi:lysophospholipase L1-like esterase
VADEIAPGDVVLIQFGHNDGGAINDRRRARGSIRGIGDETEEIDNLMTGQPETVHSFGWYMSQMIRDAREKGASVVVLSQTARNIWKNGHVERSGIFSRLSEAVAERENVPFLPLTEMIADQYEYLGNLRVAELFPVDHTHTSRDGAFLNAAIVTSGLRALDEMSFHPFMSEAGQAVQPYASTRLLKPVEQWLTRPWMPDAQPVSRPELPTLYAIGDSTVRNGTKGDGSNGQWGWGAPLADFFDRTRINVENHALGGTSSRTYRTLGLWKKVVDRLEPGDFVLIQFGHNDRSPVNDNRRARGTLAGFGDEAEEIDNLLTGKPETVYTYGWYLRQCIKDIQGRGAVAIVCSPVPEDHFRDGQIDPGRLEQYAEWAAAVAAEEGVPFIALQERVADRYNALGEEIVGGVMFGQGDQTHTSAAGARLIAEEVMSGIRALPECSLKEFLKSVESQ